MNSIIDALCVYAGPRNTRSVLISLDQPCGVIRVDAIFKLVWG